MKKLINYLLLFSILLTPFFTIASTVKAGELDYVPAYEGEKNSFLTKVGEHIRGTRHFRGKRGTEDCHYPKKISVHKVIPLPVELHFPVIIPALQDDNLDLNLVVPDMVMNLSREDLRSLLRYLSSKQVKLRYHCQGKWHFHPIHAIFKKKVNGTTALALLMGTENHKAFSNILGSKLDSILPELKGRSSSLLCKSTTAQTLLYMMTHLNKENPTEISLLAARLVDIYVTYWAGKDAHKLDKALRELVIETRNFIQDLPEEKKLTPKQLGLLLGSLLAGTLQHAQKIKRIDEKRLWDVNTATNLIWATTTFLGVAPWFAGNVAVAGAGGISVVAVLGQASYNYCRRPRDYSDIIKHIKGQIEMSALENLQDHEPMHNEQSKLDTYETIICEEDMDSLEYKVCMLQKQLASLQEKVKENEQKSAKQVAIIQQRDKTLEMIEWINAAVHTNGLAN